jgi:hypothetical protein
MPGSGDYINRIAFGGDRYIENQGTKYLLECVRWKMYPPDHYISDYNRYEGLSWLDRHHLVYAYCERRRQGEPSIRDKWIVGVHAAYIPNGWQRIRPYWYLLFANKVNFVYKSAGGFFSESEDSAVDFFFGWLTQPASHSPVGTWNISMYRSSTSVSGGLQSIAPRLSNNPTLGSIDDLYAIGDPHHLGFESGVAAAYIKAVDGLPTARGMNNVANLFQALNALKAAISAVKGDFSGLTELGDLDDAWLGYRYEYNTTKQDILELNATINRVRALNTKTVIRSNGVVERDGWVFRSSVRVVFKGFQDLQSVLERWGLELNGFVVWDLIPYSFIVDWFLDIGGMLEYGNLWTLARDVSPNTVWNSAQKTFINEFGCRELYYYRFHGVPNLSLSLLTYRKDGSAGAPTIIKRGLDLLALFS